MRLQTCSAIMQTMDWDIFRFVIAVADSGSAVAAAKLLGVDGTTVIRRISKFEDERGVKLFDRLPTGYSPTVECEAILNTARDIQENVAEINRGITGQDLRLEGNISVTTTDSFLESVLAEIIAEFCQLHPEISIDIMVTTNRLNLSRQDAHVAIRASKSPQANLICQRVSAVAFAIYGAQSLTKDLPTVPTIDDLALLPWIGLGESLSLSPAMDWMRQHIPDSQIKTMADTFVGMRALTRNGAGLSVLPCCLGDQEDRLTRVGLPLDEMDMSLWVLTHSDVRKAAKVRAFTSYAGQKLREKSHILEGT